MSGLRKKHPTGWRALAVLALVALAVAGLMAAVSLAKPGSASASPTVCSGNTCTWHGQGATNGSVDTVQCDANNTPYLLWIFTVGGGGNTVSSATLTLGGTGSGSYVGTKMGNEFHFTTPYFTPDPSTLTASVAFVGSLGRGTANLVISHGCPGETTTTTTPGTTTTPPSTTTVTTPGGTTTVTTPGSTTTVTTPGQTTTTTVTVTTPTPPKHHKKPHVPKKHHKHHVPAPPVQGFTR